MTTFDTILTFWFEELEPQQWWQSDAAVDAEIDQRFHPLHHAACAGELSDWRRTAMGRLAEIIVLDQFSRNLFRGDRRAFAQDGMALVLAQEAIRAGADQACEAPRKAFFYMPFMHSESASIHTQALTLFGQSGAEFNLPFEIKHKAIIDRFGRYPHRNTILGRTSTPAELAFLTEPDSSF